MRNKLPECVTPPDRPCHLAAQTRHHAGLIHGVLVAKYSVSDAEREQSLEKIKEKNTITVLQSELGAIPQSQVFHPGIVKR